ncbi:hypothetical protein ElyMa_006106600 [Elysia marginata]|uniref:Ig-like domain-containing protein n=1 Tax=Elysia marginata TaxID=1093978 RepID=A0AAV4GVK1_9GAST|nr:hypothetical protein ElyMa_006106600 [Elysia marginata]
MRIDEFNLLLSLAIVHVSVVYSVGQQGIGIKCPQEAVPIVPEDEADIVASLEKLENCQDNYDQRLWGTCTVLDEKEHSDVQFFFTTHNDALTSFYTKREARVFYNKSETHVVRKGSYCVYQSTARFRIPVGMFEKAGAKGASFGCINDHLSTQSNTVQVKRLFQPCQPEFEANFDLEPSTVRLGNILRFRCHARVGLAGKLTWVILTKDGGIIQTSRLNDSVANDAAIVDGSLDESDQVQGPTITSAMTFPVPRLFNGSRIACLVSANLQSGTHIWQIIKKLGNLAEVTDPIQVLSPGKEPVVTIFYHEKPDTLYFYEHLSAHCAAQMEPHDKGNLKWTILMGGKVYFWTITGEEINTTHSDNAKQLRDVKISILDAFTSASGKLYKAIRIYAKLGSNFQGGQLECHHTLASNVVQKSAPKSFTVKYAPQSPDITSQYVSVDSKPATEIVCKSYVGTDGYLVWSLSRPKKPNVTWGYDVTGKRFGSAVEDVFLHPPTTSYTQENGPALKTAATIKISYKVDSAVVMCMSSLDRQVLNPHPRTFYNSVDISVMGKF